MQLAEQKHLLIEYGDLYHERRCRSCGWWDPDFISRSGKEKGGDPDNVYQNLRL